MNVTRTLPTLIVVAACLVATPLHRVVRDHDDQRPGVLNLLTVACENRNLRVDQWEYEIDSLSFTYRRQRRNVFRFGDSRHQVSLVRLLERWGKRVYVDGHEPAIEAEILVGSPESSNQFDSPSTARQENVQLRSVFFVRRQNTLRRCGLPAIRSTARDRAI